MLTHNVSSLCSLICVVFRNCCGELENELNETVFFYSCDAIIIDFDLKSKFVPNTPSMVYLNWRIGLLLPNNII